MNSLVMTNEYFENILWDTGDGYNRHENLRRDIG